MLQSNSKDYLFDFLQTSVSSASSVGASAFDFPSHIPPPSSYAAHGPPAPYPFFPLVSAVGEASASSSSATPGYAEAKEKLSKLCEQLQMTNTSTAVFPQATAGGGIVLDISLDSIPGGEEASGSGESGQGSPAQTEADDSSQDLNLFVQSDML